MTSTRTGVTLILAGAFVAAGLALADAARAHRGVFAQTAATHGVGGLPLSAPLPDRVPPGVTVTIGDPMTQVVLEHTGWIRELPFQVKWAEIAGGPAVTEAFHARALDVGSAADIPPIHAVWVGMPVKMIAIHFRQDPVGHPVFMLAVAPGAGVRSLADLKGKRIAFSPGQVQGEIVLRSLEAAGLTRRDVTLVELPSTSADLYINALVGGMIDVAPIAPGPAARRYVANYGARGARLIRHSPVRDDLADLYVRDETLQDPGKAAALKAYVKLWARAQAWIAEHPQEWAQIYYQNRQGLSVDDARFAVQTAGQPEIPARWDEAIALEQASIDLMARETHHPAFSAASLFDRRFEPVLAEASAEAARSPLAAR
jgi:sulfonate transport system substrate-binding protein